MTGGGVGTGLDMFSLDGKRALITGGNRGLGFAFTKALAQCGASVAFVGRDQDANDNAVKRLATDGVQAHAIGADLTVDDDVQRAVDEAITALGGLDVLVNNAGSCIHNPAWDATDDEWAQVFDLNVRALWKTSLAAGRHMRVNGGGSIVNIGSDLGDHRQSSAGPGVLQRFQGGRTSADEIARRGMGAGQYSRECRGPRLREDRHGAG